jgi:membrane-associated phospholipid phosphatase
MPFEVCLVRRRRAWRRARALGLASAFSVLGVSSCARADECSETRPWAHLSATGANFVRPTPLLLSALAVATPFGFAPTGLDQRLRIVAQRDLPGRPNLEPVSVWTPYVLAGGLFVGYGVSLVVASCTAQRLIAPVIQAGVLTYVVTGALKFAVGRRFPNGGDDPNAPDRLNHPQGAHDFKPFQRGFGGFPSGHTALMVAAASAFRAANPQLGWVAWLGYPLAAGVATGMWLGDHHYASDIISGGLFGEAIGGSVGRGFAEAANIPGQLTLMPLDQTGFELTWLGVW